MIALQNQERSGQQSRYYPYQVFENKNKKQDFENQNKNETRVCIKVNQFFLIRSSAEMVLGLGNFNGHVEKQIDIFEGTHGEVVLVKEM